MEWENSSNFVAATANYTQTMMYWHIGERINRECLEISVLSTESKLSRQCHDNCKKSKENMLLISDLIDEI